MMNGLYRDCTINPNEGDDTCINSNLKCRFITTKYINGKSKEELDLLSFLPIKNCFSDMSFGGCDRNIYGATPPKILHTILLGLCEYISRELT